MLFLPLVICRGNNTRVRTIRLMPPGPRINPNLPQIQHCNQPQSSLSRKLYITSTCFSLTVSKSAEHPHPSLGRGGSWVRSGGRAQRFPYSPTAAVPAPLSLLDSRKQRVEKRQLVQANEGTVQQKTADAHTTRETWGKVQTGEWRRETPRGAHPCEGEQAARCDNLCTRTPPRLGQASEYTPDVQPAPVDDPVYFAPWARS